ncbi:Mut7-C RNAse domain-containing protein [Piscinibacter sp.]|uniref:Mut7-C RNAse domain-containing protein n=1 Tax=Piscinibacter sp. TaxID=1903157 RepID=UPI00355A6A4E
MSVVATFRFYEELNDFVAPARRQREFELACARAATVKNAIESAGVPHTEVELILANGESVDFAYRVRDGDRISVYPKFEALDIRPLLRVRAQPLRESRFTADAHLGGLARLLRMLGFDTLYDNAVTDDELRRVARNEGRIILTRDRALLMCRDVTHGCYVHALKTEAQLREVVERLQLAGQATPFTRCLHCNVVLLPIDKALVHDALPPRVAASQTVFSHCPACARVFWPGDHYRRMRAMLGGLLADLPV